MVDVGKLFDKARDLVDQSITTAGTSVRIANLRSVLGPDLKPVVTVENARTEDAIVTLAGLDSGFVTPNLQVQSTDWRIIFKASIELPDLKQFITVLGSKDPRLEGISGEVLGHAVDSSGAYTAVYARPQHQGTWNS